jgi:hypothetical protein
MRKVSLTIYLFIIFAGVFLLNNLYRVVWFDETLTVFTMVQSKNLLEIYQNYIIPNNQIVYTCLLRLWSDWNLFGLSYDVYLRLLNFVISLIILGYLYKRFKVRFGSKIVCLCVGLTLLFSPPFQIYSTALRGYQLSMLLILIATDLSLEIARKISWQKVLLYLIISTLAVGTIPTNLLGVGMGVILVMPLVLATKNWLKKLIILGGIPFLGLLIFYLPILDKFINVCKLGEGIPDRWHVYWIVILSFASSAFVILVAGLIGFIRYFQNKKNRNLRYLWWIFLIIAPLIPCLCLHIAPYYRVFYPTFIVWYILLGLGMKHFFALRLMRSIKKRVVRLALGFVVTLLVVVSAWQNVLLGEIFSEQCNPHQDDLFMPYYVRDDFELSGVMQFLRENHWKSENIYCSFDSDPMSFMFYLTYNDEPYLRKFKYNVGKMQIKRLKPNDLVIVRKNAPVTHSNRKVKKIAEFPYHDIYKCEEYIDDFIR